MTVCEKKKPAAMDGGGYNPRTVEEVFRDFKGRRAGLIKALTKGEAFILYPRISLSFSPSLFRPHFFSRFGAVFSRVVSLRRV